MSESLNIRKMDVDTPLGVVHLAAFPKGGQGLSHRDVIFEILSRYTGREVSANNLTKVRGILDGASSRGERPSFLSLDFDVNWTHSGGECVVAFGEKGSLDCGTGLHLGVDMEMHNPRRLPVANRFFSLEEKALLKGFSPSGDLQCPDVDAENRCVREFFRLWCRKEAFYKCVGGSFFEGAVGRNMLDNPLVLRIAELPPSPLQVHFVDLPWGKNASLCIDVCRT